MVAAGELRRLIEDEFAPRWGDISLHSAVTVWFLNSRSKTSRLHVISSEFAAAHKLTRAPRTHHAGTVMIHHWLYCRVALRGCLCTVGLCLWMRLSSVQAAWACAGLLSGGTTVLWKHDSLPHSIYCIYSDGRALCGAEATLHTCERAKYAAGEHETDKMRCCDSNRQRMNGSLPVGLVRKANATSQQRQWGVWRCELVIMTVHTSSSCHLR